MADNPPFRFVFELSNETHIDGKDAIFVYWFPFLDEIAKVKTMSADEAGDFQGRTEELEQEYGVHDFATSGEHELIGFHSYEVAPEKWMELMQKWRAFFVEQGVPVGEVTGMRRAVYEQQLCS
jgi:hypothetical protein